MESEQKNVTETGVPNYAAEQKKIEEGGQWVRFEEGETIVNIKSEMTPEYDKQFPSGTDRVRDLDVEINGETKTWSLKVGGKKSVYYKVLEIATRRGSLKGAKIRVMRQGKDKDNTNYIIMEVPDEDGGYQNVNRTGDKPEDEGSPPTA